MDGLTISIDDRDVLDALARLLGAAGDLTPALKNIGDYGRKSTIDRIKREETPDGTPFAPLNPEYADEKKGPGILRGDSLQLSDIVWQLAGDDSVEWGNQGPHVRIHQFGGTIKPKNASALVFALGGRQVTVGSVTIPARPYLGINAEDEAEILAIVADHFEDALGTPFE
jgi:phage virion morphogenesis protein